MKKIYRDQNYIIIEADGQILALPATRSIYAHVIAGEDRQEAAFSINAIGINFIIQESDISAGNWEDDASNPYSLASMEIFLRTNTGY